MVLDGKSLMKNQVACSSNPGDGGLFLPFTHLIVSIRIGY